MILTKIAVVLVAFIKVISSVVVLDGAYKGITVGLHPDLLESDCNDIVNSIQTMFQSANGVLSEANGPDFGSIYIIIPEKWTNCGSFSIETVKTYLTYDRSDVRVGKTHPIFGDEPWTSQPRGCGLPGEFISYSSNWLLSNGDDSTKGSRLVHEWAKYRWGVFEEYGHYGDLVYPESSRREGGSWEPNYCTNSPLNGNFDSSCDASSDCRFTITDASPDTPAVTSSLLATPSVSSVNKFCDSANHRNDIPSKQNLLCNYSSTWDIIENHPDILEARMQREGRESVSVNAEVKIVRENFAVNLIITYETSGTMNDVSNRFAFEKESIAQFITYEAPSSASIGLVSFDKSIVKTLPLPLTSPNARTNLSEIVLTKTKLSDSPEINLYNALSASASLLSDGGIILLFTKCTGENPDYSYSQLVTAAAGHPVWIILYPKTTDTYLDVYSKLANLTGGMLIPIEEETESNAGVYTITNVRMKLSQAFRQLLHQDPGSDLGQMTYYTCPAGEPECNFSFKAPSNFQDPMYVYIYHDLSEETIDPTLSYSTGICTTDPFGGNVKTTYVYKCNNMGTGASFNFNINRSRYLTDLTVELVGHPYTKATDYVVNLKASTNLFDMRYTDSTAPAIYVQVSNNGTFIVYANVYAVIGVQDNGTTSTIYLRDDGSGADVTGNDGTYSAYLIPAIPVGDFDIFVFADDNDTEARFLPTQYDGTSRVCCGSKIPLPSNLKATNSFGVKNYSAAGTIVMSPDYLNLPPGTVRDLRFYNHPSNSKIEFTFTDVGEDLDYGIVDHYMVKIYDDNMNLTTEKRLNITPKKSGSYESFSMPAITCDQVYILSIYGVDNEALKGGESNRVTVYVPCDSSSGLSAGAWVGIAIAALLILILFIAGLIYGIYYKDKSKNKGKHSRLASCTCCEKDEENDNDNKVESSKNETVISHPVQKITSINDLIAESNLNRQTSQLAHEEVEDDTYLARTVGVSEMETLPRGATGGYLSGSFQYAAVKKYDSERSLHSIPPTNQFVSSHSINNVGVPMRTPTSSIGDFVHVPEGRSHDSLYNTAV